MISLVATYDDNGIKTIKDGIIQDLYVPSGDNWSKAITHLTDIEVCGDTTWVGTRRDGVYLFTKDLTLTHLSSISEPSIAGNRISQIYRDKRGRILIGSFEGGLSICDGSNIKKLTVEDGLSSNSVCSIAEDESGDLWIVCRAGISHLDANDKVVMTYDHEYGIKAREFSPNSIARSSDGTIWVGSIDGLISFKPSDIKVNTHIPPIAITSIKVNNKVVPIVKGETLELKHNESNITLSFSALNYIYPGKNQYKYMLVGSDHKWITSRENRYVNYNDLRPGRYTFKVMGSNNDGIWNPEAEVFKIRISPAPWNSWWSWTIYFLLSALIAYVIVHTSEERRKMAAEVRRKTNEVEDSRRRIEMYTNIAHDLRTPLSLIISPLEDLISSSETAPKFRKGLASIHSNAERMHRIVDQMMDLRCQEEGTAILEAAEGDIAGFAEEIFVAFKYQAEKRGILYSFTAEDRPVLIWYDRTQFEKVLMNILSNAFKFTPDGGNINMSIKANDEQEKIFDPFYRASTQDYYEGSGIGLSIAAYIVKQHGGEILVESSPNEGTTIIINMKKGRAHLKDSEIVSSYESSETVERYYRR